MKNLFKFVGWSVAVVMGFALTNWIFGQLGELVTAKNSVAVAVGLFGFGILLGVWGWVIFTALMKVVRIGLKWDPDGDEETWWKAAKNKNCCQNDCGCDRSNR